MDLQVFQQPVVQLLVSEPQLLLVSVLQLLVLFELQLTVLPLSLIHI